MKSNAVTEARKRTRLGVTGAARNAGVGRQAIKNLENGPGTTRETDPVDCKLGTVLNLMQLYWPHLQLKDLVPNSPFKLVPIDCEVGRRLRRDVGKPLD